MRYLTHPILTVHQHAFLKLLTYRVFIVLAYQMMAVTVGWHIFEITHDTLSLGLIGLVEVVPYFATALFQATRLITIAHVDSLACLPRFYLDWVR